MTSRRPTASQLPAIAALAGALAAGLLVSSPAHALPAGDVPDSSTPASKALVHVDGGRAHATKTGRHEYRLVLSRKASITWLGETASGRVGIGTFSIRGLVAGWTRLGHVTKPWATITWRERGADRPTFTLARVSAPRVNRDGRLVFVAHSDKRLPQTLREATVSIRRAAYQPRSYPLEFSRLTVTSDVGMHLTATSDTSATLNFDQYDDTGWGACTAPAAIAMSSPAPVQYTQGTCGDVTYEPTDSDGNPQVVWPTFTMKTTGVSEVTTILSVSLTDDTPAGQFDYYWFLGSWQKGGVIVSDAVASG